MSRKLEVEPATLAAGLELLVGESYEVQFAPAGAPEGVIHVAVRGHDSNEPVPHLSYEISGGRVSFKGETDARGLIVGDKPVPVDVYVLKIGGLEFPVDARDPAQPPRVVRMPGFGHPQPPPNPSPGLPPRPRGAAEGRNFLQRTMDLPILPGKSGSPDRESAVFREIVSGNVPDWCRTWCEVRLAHGGHTGVVEVLPDYLAIGSNDDFVRMPMSAYTAQRIADVLDAVLPTQVLVDAIYEQAQVKLVGHNLPPGPRMNHNDCFLQHEDVLQGRAACSAHGGRCALSGAPGAALTAGHKKDVIISQEIRERPARLSFWGWYFTYGKADPVQKWSGGFHGAGYCDYSHGIRLVRSTMKVDGVDRRVGDVLHDPQLAGLLTGAVGPIPARYPDPPAPPWPA